MTKEHIITILQSDDVKKELLDAGIMHLWLFGSYAKGTQTDTSDIDLVYDRDQTQMKPHSRWPTSAYACISDKLSKQLDLMSIKYIDPLIEKAVLSYMVPIY